MKNRRFYWCLAWPPRWGVHREYYDGESVVLFLGPLTVEVVW